MTEPRNNLIADTTLTASGIARLAGVGRAAVSNWRRRYADFPAPVGGTPASPYFNAQEIDDWLRRQGKMTQGGAGQWAWRHIETYQPAAKLGQMLGIAGAHLLLSAAYPDHVIGRPGDLADRLADLDPELADLARPFLPDEWTAPMTAVLAAVDQFADEQEPESAFEYLHTQYVSSGQSMSGLAGTPDIVAEVMLTLSGIGTTTFDFTCGTGSILRMAAQRASAAGTPTQTSAQEIKTEYALIALIRLWFVHLRTRVRFPGMPAPVLRIGDSLLGDAFAELRADTVVSNFPFGIHDWGHDDLVYDPRWTYGLPPRTEPELAWVQHALAHLAPGGTAVVLMPPAAASRPAGRRIRAELIRSGTLRAIVALPAGLMPPTGLGLNVWVLSETTPDRVPDPRILFVDASAADDLTELVAAAWRGFQNGGGHDQPGVHRAVPIIDLLDDRVDLTPRRQLPVRDQSGDPSQFESRIEEVNRLIAELGRGFPAVRTIPAGGIANATQASLADLVRSGSMSVDRFTGRVPASLQPDDIVMSMLGRELNVYVAVSSSIEPVAGSYILHIDPERFDPWFVAGVLSRADDHRVAVRGSSSGSGVPRVDLRGYTIPVLGLEEQRVYGHVFKALAQFQSNLDNIATLGNAIVQEIRSSLSEGTVSPSV